MQILNLGGLGRKSDFVAIETFFFSKKQVNTEVNNYVVKKGLDISKYFSTIWIWLHFFLLSKTHKNVFPTKNVQIHMELESPFLSHNLQIWRKIISFKVWFGLVWLCGPWILRSSDGISHFSGIFPLAQEGLNPHLPDSWSSRLPGIREKFRLLDMISTTIEI